MNVRILLATGLLLVLLAACTKVSPPLQLFFIGSTRFTSGNKTGVGPGDTLATRLYATDSSRGNGLARLRITTTYSPSRQPFAYPLPLTAFLYTSLPPAEEVVYLDSTLAVPNLHTFLYTSVFSARTTSGSERWQYEMTGADGNTASRSFVVAVRRADSATVVYHDYYLRLNVPARDVRGGPANRRFIQLKSGLALPAYSVLGTSGNPTPSQQGLTDLVQSVDGLQLFSPDTLGSVVTLPELRWPSQQRRATRFRLTALNATGYSSQQDTISIRQQYTQSPARPRQSLRGLTANQVFAFRTAPYGGAPSTFGLLRVVSVPGGSSAGLQLEVRVAKQPQSVAFSE